jgi:acid stress-induced BolA-like protein IbaG/YrbA
MDRKIIEQMIRDGLPDAEVTVSGDDGVHFEAVVISASFAGKSTLQRHRMVYATLGEKMGHEIHALGLKTEVPDPQSEETG